MTSAIDCECGRTVAFTPGEQPLTETCECGREWELIVRQTNRYEGWFDDD